jgi:hypothetical protein
MSETSAAEVDAVLDGASNIVAEFTTGRFAALGSDPCAQEMQLREWDAEVYRVNMARVAGVAAAMSSQLQRAIDRSIRTRGHAGMTGTPLEVWLSNNLGLPNLTPTAEEAGIATIGILTAGAGLAVAIPAALGRVRSRLPSVAAIEAGTVSDQRRGLRVGPDVYLWASGVADNPTTPREKTRARELGKLQGPAIASEVAAWIGHQVDTVTPPDFPSIRNRLNRVVGSSTGSGSFGVWEPGDPVAPGSRLGQLEAIRRDVRERRAELDARCVAAEEEGRSLTRQRQESDLEFRRLALWSAAGFGVFAVVAWSRTR